MPLGDSITGSPGCWRAVLWNQLRNAGHTDIAFAGTPPGQGCGLAYDGDNEGHGGELVTGVADQDLPPGRLAATRPDIVVMHFGTNDVWSSVSPDRILAPYTKLVTQMRAADPDTRLLVARIIPLNPASCAGCAQRVVDLNALIPGWAEATSTGRSPATSYAFAVYARDAAGNRSQRSATVTVTTSSGGSQGTREVRYRVTNEWPGGFQGEVTVRNTGGSAIDGWTLNWTFPGAQRITDMWGGTPAQTGSEVSVASAPYTAAIPAAGSVTLGFTATTTDRAPSPSAFTLNGSACSVA
ncbi:cellulose binding domain-containing protein [Streptomyces sp. M2CJ-2]|uniref:cellulose binding domain-containing protein n=1 Tax=Streptomyces sp. M2CJ-2 TaxID=2803948 RepID=UPI0019246D94|nr:cellulose binding domain-containing protein [Streptomyces sp. M2CJ-2]MBL3664807.1 cellulose binding domain-containing protein [Streptomyces sp. M2CJ-2]